MNAATASSPSPSTISPPPAPLVAVQALTKRFGGLVAVDGVSFSIARGSITALIGPNGAGKTTLFNCLTGFYRPSSGCILAYPHGGVAENLAKLPPHKVARRAGIARTFQNIRLFKRLSVLENVLVAQHDPLTKAARRGFAGLLGLPAYKKAEQAAVELARYWLEQLNIVHLADQEAGSLSYGAQRRLEIARALALAPQLLCLDEPAAGLNPSESSELAKFLKALRDKHGFSILLIEHDMRVVMGIATHIVVLDHGQKIADGTPKTVQQNQAVIKAYLGEPDAGM